MRETTDNGWTRVIWRCPYCKGKRRHIHRFIFSGYGSDIICGGCGNMCCDLARVSTSASIRKKNRMKVKQLWPNAGNYKAAFDRLMDDIEASRELGGGE